MRTGHSKRRLVRRHTPYEAHRAGFAFLARVGRFCVFAAPVSRIFRATTGPRRFCLLAEDQSAAGEASANCKAISLWSEPIRPQHVSIRAFSSLPPRLVHSRPLAAIQAAPVATTRSAFTARRPTHVVLWRGRSDEGMRTRGVPIDRNLHHISFFLQPRLLYFFPLHSFSRAPERPRSPCEAWSRARISPWSSCTMSWRSTRQKEAERASHDGTART